MLIGSALFVLVWSIPEQHSAKYWPLMELWKMQTSKPLDLRNSTIEPASRSPWRKAAKTLYNRL
ncbi:hypothetical protein RBY4I_1820 [Rhodobacterales bacterium Y4I]|nr:hypothetical protein RBY4I_1820 [Rhodobacterales bacterium Y4I]